MAYAVSKATVVGRLAADVELRQTSDGKSVADVRLCANVFRGKDKEETPVWFKFTLWEKHAEVLAPMLKKGMLVYVDGDLIVDEYTDKEGGRRFQLVILQPNVILMSGERGEKREGGKKSSDRFPRD